MTGKKYVYTLLLLVGLVISTIYFVGMGIELDDTISPEDYLAKLNDNDTFGCKNSIRVNPDILVFGDSHAYAGIDFNILANTWGTQKIATCTLGSMFIESVLFALKHYESLDALPKTVIWGISTRSFWEESNKKEMMFSHKSQITAINSGDLLFSVQNIVAFFSQEYDGFYNDLQERRKKHRPFVEAMNEEHIATVFEKSAHNAKHMANWLRRIKEAEFTPESKEIVRQIGEIITRNNIDLYVVALPESPWLEKQYPTWIRDKYYELLDEFTPFAKAVLIYTTDDVGLGNRHFINRSLRSGYDYSKWDDPNFSDSSDVDADHIGSIGAVLFSEIMTKDIVAIRDGLKQ